MNKKLLRVVAPIGLIAIGLAVLISRWAAPPAYSPPFTEKDQAEFAGIPAGPSPQTQSLLKPIDLSKPIRLAIGGMGLADNELSRQLGDLATVQLTGTPGFILVERTSLDAVLRELNLSWSGFVRAKDAVQVGKLLKVDWFLLGTETQINGTNSLVVRMVDAHTGVMRDAEIFPSKNSPAKLASDLAAFARRTREDAAKARMRVYVALGGFEDLSPNNRRADFLPQLRGYLTAAYRGGNVTLLEREYVETLLQEMRLDLAGMTREEGSNPSEAAQSAFWLVGGQYQSYETTNYQVEVKLNVRRIFGRTKDIALRGSVGDPINKQIKDAIDEVMSQAASVIIPTRLTEARAQMASGRDLLGIPVLARDSDLFWDSGGWISDSGLAELRKRNVEEAIRSFETALLLEPTNREAMVYLSLSLRDPSVEKIEEARRYYFEIIADPIPDRWLGIAKAGLLKTFEERATMLEPNPAVAAPWYEAAAMRATNAVAIQYFRSQAEDFRAKLNPQNDPAKTQELAFANVFSSITNSWHKRRYTGDLGVGGYLSTFGTNRAAAAHRLNESYSKFMEQAPELSQYILASIVVAQVETNASVIIEFKKMLDDLAIHPDRISDPTNFWQNSWTVSEWSFQYKDYDLAIKLLEGEIRFRSEHPKVMLGGYDKLSDDKLALAYAYADVGKWKETLAIFESFGNQAVRANLQGPWGEMFTLVFPPEFAELCREKLGLPSQKDPREFSMGKAALFFGLPSTFTVDDHGLWFGGVGELIHLDFELKTNDIIKLPSDDFAPITAICIASSNIWIGTSGGGLIEYDKDSKKCRLFTVKDGMMMDAVSALNLVGDTLWIGYWRGLGKLEIPFHRFVSFTPPMTLDFMSKAANSSTTGTVMPTKSAVIKLAGAEKDNVWMLTDGENPTPQLFQYRSKGDTWIAGGEGPAMDADAEHLVVGQYRTPPVSIQNLKDGQWRGLNASTNLPTGLLTAITLDGDNVWVGGVRSVAQLDAAHDKMIHFAYLKQGSVGRIQIGGGYLWVQCGRLLYRAPLPN